MLTVALVAALLVAQDDEPAIRILKEAMAAKDGDTAAYERALSAIDAELAKDARVPNGHYARGWILARLKRIDDAVAAYEEAARLKPDFADALYNAGVTLARAGRHAHAAVRFDAAAAADPAHVDALYNGGQAYYNAKDFKNALDRWQKARTLTPHDFNCIKKVLQALNALGNAEAAAKTRGELFELWRTSKEPAIRELKSFVFDQWEVGKARVYAYEFFEPKGDLFNVYKFLITDAKDATAGSVNLESSAAIREQGTPYVLGVSRGREHLTPGPFFKELPSVAALKPEVVKLVEAHFPATVKGAP